MKVLISEKLSPHKYKTPEGYLICVDAILARTGKQTYRRNELFTDGDDSEVEVDRKPEEVFAKETLASFENKPVTVEHPDEDVNSGNIKDYAVGFVRDVHKGVVDGQDVILGTLVIQDEQTIEEIENGEHTELSCGYDCDIIDEENPQQKHIRGNHVALCESGRAGNARIVDSKMKDDNNSEYIKGLAKKYGQHRRDSVKDANRDINGIKEYFKVWGYPSRNELQEVVNFYKLSRAEIEKIFENHYDKSDYDKLTYKDSVKDEALYMIIDKDEGKYIYNIDLRNGKYNTTNDVMKAEKYTIDNARKIINELKKYNFNLTSSEYLGDSVKDELYNGYHIDKELNEYVVYDKHYNKEYGRYKSLEEAKINCKYNTFDSVNDGIDVGSLVKDLVHNDQIRISSWTDDGKITLDLNQLYSTDVNQLCRVIKQRGYNCKILNTRTVKVSDELVQSESEKAFKKNIITEIKDELYSLQELREMRVDNYRGIDIYKIYGQYSTNPNTSNRRFNTLEQVKEYIDNGFKDSIKDDQFFSNVRESKLRQSKDFKLKELFEELDKIRKMPISIKKENDIYDIKLEIEKRVKQLKNVPNDIQDEETPYEEVTKNLEKNINDAYLIQSKYNNENYLQEDNHFGMNKKFAQKFNSYEEAAKKANILYSDWNKHVNIIKDSKKFRDEQTISRWTKKLSNGIPIDSAIIKYNDKTYTFVSGIIKEDKDFSSLDEAEIYAKKLGYKIKDSISKIVKLINIIRR